MLSQRGTPDSSSAAPRRCILACTIPCCCAHPSRRCRFTRARVPCRPVVADMDGSQRQFVVKATADLDQSGCGAWSPGFVAYSRGSAPSVHAVSAGMRIHRVRCGAGDLRPVGWRPPRSSRATRAPALHELLVRVTAEFSVPMASESRPGDQLPPHDPCAARAVHRTANAGDHGVSRAGAQRLRNHDCTGAGAAGAAAGSHGADGGACRMGNPFARRRRPNGGERAAGTGARVSALFIRHGSLWPGSR